MKALLGYLLIYEILTWQLQLKWKEIDSMRYVRSIHNPNRAKGFRRILKNGGKKNVIMSRFFEAHVRW